MSTTPVLTRRRHPRIDIDGTRPAQNLTHGHWVQVRNVSLGGFLTASPRSVQPGETHTFRALLRDGDACVLRATAIHCRPAVGTMTTCIVGWRAAPDAVTVAAMQRLIDDVTTVDGMEVVDGASTDRDPECA